MTRIGVMTFLHNDNYGSILQAWALQRTLEELGFEAGHIDYAPSKQEKLRNMILSGNSPRLILEGMRKRSATSKMHGGFEEFRQAHLRTGRPCPDSSALKQRAEEFDVLICGSDQIWSPVWLNPAYFLNFAHQPRIAYAPSLGVKELPEKRKQKRIARLVEGFRDVSVREEEGAALLRAMTGRDVPVMPDPVMLVTAQEWRSLMKGSIPNKPYVLCYFIGSSDTYWQEVNRAAEREQCEVRVIPRTEEARQAGYALEEDVSPQRWLSLIGGAARLVTDSFHGAAFAAILNIPCTLVRRYREDDPESKNSRIDQLLRNLHVDSLDKPDWSVVNDSLGLQREKGRKWLLDVISRAAR